MLLERLHDAGGLDWSRAALDSASVPAKKGSEATGPNPTDRGRPGSKRRFVVDARGTPLGLTLSGAHRNDSMQLYQYRRRFGVTRTGVDPEGFMRCRASKLDCDACVPKPKRCPNTRAQDPALDPRRRAT